MKTSVLSVVLATFIGAMALSAPAIAQTKTVKACEDEWKANKAANQAAKITEKVYVEKCRAGTAAAKPAAVKPAAAKPEAAKPAVTGKKTAKPEAKSSSTAGSQKTVKACEDEWKANKAANQAAKITEKAYVEKCRADGTAAAKPAMAPAAPAAKPSTAAAPARPTAAPAAGKPAGANQYAAEGQAKSRCPTDTVVWANLDSKIFHFAGHNDYGHTKSGAYMCEKDAVGQGMRAAKNEKRP